MVQLTVRSWMFCYCHNPPASCSPLPHTSELRCVLWCSAKANRSWDRAERPSSDGISTCSTLNHDVLPKMYFSSFQLLEQTEAVEKHKKKPQSTSAGSTSIHKCLWSINPAKKKRRYCDKSGASSVLAISMF